jgi:uncharacterized membrane protein YfcA
VTIPAWVPPWLKDGVAPLLAILVTIGGFLIIIYRPEAKTEIIGLMTLVLAFYFGSSRSSQAKDDAITTQLQAKDEIIKEQIIKQ